MVPALDLHGCSLGKSDKMLGNKPRFSSSFSSTYLMNLMINEHSCKILHPLPYLVCEGFGETAKRLGWIHVTRL